MSVKENSTIILVHKVYAVGFTYLYSYDPATGNWTTVADTDINFGDGSQTKQGSLAYDPATEMLYAATYDPFFLPGSVMPSLRRIDPKTGAATTTGLLYPIGPIVFALPSDHSQCVPRGGSCGFMLTCAPFTVCKTNWPPPDSPACVPTMGCPGYCGSCACLGGACSSPYHCTSADNSQLSCDL